MHSDGAGGRAELISYSQAGKADASQGAAASSNTSALAETGAFSLRPFVPISGLHRY